MTLLCRDDPAGCSLVFLADSIDVLLVVRSRSCHTFSDPLSTLAWIFASRRCRKDPVYLCDTGSREGHVHCFRSTTVASMFIQRLSCSVLASIDHWSHEPYTPGQHDFYSPQAGHRAKLAGSRRVLVEFGTPSLDESRRDWFLARPNHPMDRTKS
ncbi:hypothetical protein BV25DRAFT_1878437 [Artomyces pyxidatus]|uniref:Uncharacterized protein n=1 Tax=Artomyces pyxidatus TaxID=48021 RepID=A0ACB8TDJ6_9AGAM|nr:hypothetical protein BV25DRAFT_1878437 [Artomyces pyxidatus]